ncbi:PREDICTED: F-box/kelch-repeat protein At3g23880-like [Nelumbo nucifera]|uniref:F-box domain-containing protein n=2 Tax=Nelumbo nucifera TaxID=4432 RepID=A0A822Y2L1_NELNU|nr:PREDICTED: F-box/kelch-repeat protein At3g23880-like [Nelumbo nucifera]DAD28144.1 TPA_asm: hypothetical protein HUJ06_029612 [Nelumbo nucifera]
MAHLPENVVFSILAGLPVKSLVRFKSVDKHWCMLISDPRLVDSHLDRAKMRKKKQGLILSGRVDGDRYSTIHFFSLRLSEAGDGVAVPIYSTTVSLGRYHVLPSCNGLICFYSIDRIYICNPNIRQMVTITRSDVDYAASSLSMNMCCGFGFDCSTNQYKIIKLMESSSEPRLGAQVFSLGTGEWRKISGSPTCKLLRLDYPVSVNGFFYWITAASTFSELLVSFDIGNEKFEVVPHPECLSTKKRHLLSVVELGGHLCLVDLDFESEGNRRMDIWMMLDEWGEGEDRIWVQESIVHSSEALDAVRPVAIVDGQILLHGFIKGLGNLIWYDLHSQSFKDADVEGIPSSHFFISPHVESLVSVGKKI